MEYRLKCAKIKRVDPFKKDKILAYSSNSMSPMAIEHRAVNGRKNYIYV